MVHKKHRIASAVLVAVLALTMVGMPMPGAGSFGLVDTAKAATSEQAVPVTDLKAARKSYKSIKLTWSRVRNAKKYNIYRAETKDGKFQKIATLDKTQTEYVNTDLVCGLKYYYKVDALGGTTSFHTLADSSVGVVSARASLLKPVATIVAKTNVRVQVSWKKVPGATGYRLYKYDPTTKSYAYKKTVTADKLSYTFTKQQAGKTQAYKVAAIRTSASPQITAKTTGDRLRVTTVANYTQTTPGFWNTNAGKVITKARTKLGCPYVWGASGPNKFDCSGFTCWTMQNVGAKVTGINGFVRQGSSGLYQKYNGAYGLGRDIKDAQPGDMIIVGSDGTPNTIYHVGIYYGSGNYIHATTGWMSNGVKISAVPTSQVVAIIRLPGLERKQ